MAKIKIADGLFSGHSREGWILYCPACQAEHFYDADEFRFNLDTERPTLVGLFAAKIPGKRNAGECRHCVINGEFWYFSGCGHVLKGKRAAVPHFPEG